MPIKEIFSNMLLVKILVNIRLCINLNNLTYIFFYKDLPIHCTRRYFVLILKIDYFK